MIYGPSCGMTDVRLRDGKYICLVCKKEMRPGYLEFLRGSVTASQFTAFQRQAKKPAASTLPSLAA